MKILRKEKNQENWKRIKEDAMRGLLESENANNEAIAFSDSGILFEGKKICNFLVNCSRVIHVTDIYSDVKHYLVELEILLCDETEVIVCEIGYDELATIDYQGDIDYHLCIDYSLKSRDSRSKIAKHIKRMMPRLETSYRVVVSKLGWFTYKGKHMYAAGNRIIGQCDEVEVTTSDELQSFVLEYPDCAPNDVNRVISELLKQYIELYPGKSVILLLNLIVGIFRTLYLEAGVPIRFCLFIVGENQTYKTTIASYGSSIYNRLSDVEAHLHNFTSTSVRLLNELDIEKDMVSIVDDLNKSDSAVTERKQTEIISMLIRVGANNVSRKTMAGCSEVKGQTLFCGEYNLKNASTNNRLILLNFLKKDIDKTKLTNFEKQSDYLGLFVERLIIWASENYNKIIARLQYEHELYDRERGKTETYQERMNYNFFVLGTAYDILRMFLTDQGFSLDFLCSESDVEAWLGNVFETQVRLLELDGRKEIDYVADTYEMLEYFYEDAVTHKKPKDVWKKKVYHDEDAGLIYILGDFLVELVERKRGKVVSVYQIANQFDALGLLVKHKDKNGSRTIAIAKKRAYCIKYGAWADYVRENYASDSYD